MSNEIEKNIYAESFRIYSYEVDMTNKATLQAICQYLQEAASNHASQMGFGMSWLLANRRTWMLSRLKIAMKRYPGAGDVIVIKTWPSGADRLFILRDFILETPEGEILGAAVSSWVFMNLDTKRPVRSSSEELVQFVPEVSDRSLPANPAKIKPSEIPVKKKAFQVRYSDIDMNNHVNNIKYIEWIQESLAPAFRQHHIPADLEINFLAEAHYGHEVSLHQEDRGEGFIHTITNDDGQDICRAETVWRVLG